MSVYLFHQVDVFASASYTGNPLAVVHDANALDTDEMATITRWTNLSEAAFLLAPTTSKADYRVRIFEPKTELPFAGHPTLGACAAWLAGGGQPANPEVIVQECGAGLIRIKRDDGRLAFAAPPIVRDGSVDAELLASTIGVLGIDRADVVNARWIDNGPGWMGLHLANAATVLAIELPAGRAHHFDVGVVGLYDTGHDTDGNDCAIEVRAFFNDAGGSIREDPVTGSLNASVAQWLLGEGVLTAPYVARQTSGRVYVDQSGGDIWIGGDVDVRISGQIRI